MRRAADALAIAALLAVSGCQEPATSAARFAIGRADAGVPVVLARAPREADAPPPASLRVGLRLAPRRLLALPAAWTHATLTLAHPTALIAPRAVTLVKGVDIVPDGLGGYVAGAAVPGPLRPVAGYTLTVELWDGGPAAGTLVAQQGQAVNLVGGVNNLTVPLGLVGALAITGATPAAGWQGDAVSLAGAGFSLETSRDGLTLGGSAAAVSAATGASLATTVPALAPGSYTWQATVGGSTATSPAFAVTPVEGARLRLSATASSQTDPAVAAGGADFLPVWVDNRLAVKVDVMARPVGTDGSLPGGDQFVTAAPSTSQVRPHLAHDTGRDRYLAVWQDGASNPDIMGRFMAPDGSPLGAGIFAVAADAGQQKDPRVAFDAGNDRYVVTYRSGNDVYCRTLSGDGATVGAAVLLGAPSGAANDQDVAFSSATGHHLVVWGGVVGTDNVIRGRLLDATGAPLAAAFTIAVVAGFAQVQPAVACDAASGDFLVGWVSQVGPAEVRVRRVAAADGTLGPSALVSAAGGAKAYPRLAWVPWCGRFLLAWQVTNVDPDVYGAYVAPDGTLWGQPFAVAAGADEQIRPEVAAQPAASRSLVAYEEKIGGSRLVYAQRLR